MQDAAEPMAKKRVAFKDDVVDGSEPGNRRGSAGGGAPASSPPLSDDDLSSDPNAPKSPPRPNRFAGRGRPGGVGGAGRRPLAR